MELHNSTSTQSLGLNSVAGESIVFTKKSKRLVVFFGIGCFLLLAACVTLSVLYAHELTKLAKQVTGVDNGNTPPTTMPSTDVCNTADCLRVAGEFMKNINRSVDPCDDFYHYACDGWIRDNPIPPSENEQATYLKTSRLTFKKLRGLIEDETNLAPGSALKKVRDHYTACMDEREIERTSTKELMELLREFGSWALDNSTWNETAWEWKDVLMKLHQVYSDNDVPLFALDVVEDPTNSSRYLLTISASSLSLLKEQYNTTNNKQNIKTKEAYLEFMARVAVLLGSDNNTAYKDMSDVFQFEEELSKIMPTKSVLMKQLYDTYEIHKFDNSSQNFEWIEYINTLYKNFGGIQLKPTELVNIPTPDYLRKMVDLVVKQNKRTLSNYFGWKVIHRTIPYLSKPFRQAELEYMRKATSAIAAQPRWEQCVTATDDRRGLTFALGYIYIQKLFDMSYIPLIKSMMDDMRTAFRQEVESLRWIDKTTRQGVFEKEKAMIEKIGYPKLCRNMTLLENYYAGLEISDSHYLQNGVNISRWYTKKTLSRLRAQVDKDAWYSGPQMVNAFYNRQRNEINIMAGILQTPFFYGKEAPRVVNYGGIGMVLAHELTHGFDSGGRRFNKYGELTKDVGWTDSSLAQFNERSQCIIEQYNKYEMKGIDEVIYVNGKLTLDENIADNGGLKISYRAYQNWVEKHGRENAIPGLGKTNDQMFFLSYAQLWCSKYSPAALFQRSKTDTHTFPEYRVKGVLMNSEAFAKAYNCPIGSKMNPGPGKRCRVW